MRAMMRAERTMAMATKRAVASKDYNEDNNNNDNIHNNYDQDYSGNKDYNADNNNNDKYNGNDNEGKDSTVVVAGGFVGGGSISGSNCGGIGGGGLGGWHVVAVVSVVVCHTTTAMCGIHSNQPKEGRTAKMPSTNATQQALTSQHDKRMRERHNRNASAMAARWRWRQW